MNPKNTIELIEARGIIQAVAETLETHGDELDIGHINYVLDCAHRRMTNVLNDEGGFK